MSSVCACGRSRLFPGPPPNAFGFNPLKQPLLPIENPNAAMHHPMRGVQLKQHLSTKPTKPEGGWVRSSPRQEQR